MVLVSYARDAHAERSRLLTAWTGSIMKAFGTNS